MAISGEVRPLRADEVMHFPAGDSTCLHHLDKGEYYILNAVAAFIWGQCDGLLTIDDIVAKVVSAFEVDTSVAQTDAIEWVESMLSSGCLRLAGG